MNNPAGTIVPDNITSSHYSGTGGILQPFINLVPDQNQQLAEAAAMELFVSMFQDCFRLTGDLNDHYTNQLMNQFRSNSSDPFQEFSIRFLERAYAIFQTLQSQATIQEPNIPRLQDNSPYLAQNMPNDSWLSSAPAVLSIQDQNAWLGHFPVPEDMLNSPPQLLPSVGLNNWTEFSATQFSEYGANIAFLGSQFDLSNVDSLSTAPPTSLSIAS